MSRRTSFVRSRESLCSSKQRRREVTSWRSRLCAAPVPGPPFLIRTPFSHQDLALPCRAPTCMTPTAPETLHKPPFLTRAMTLTAGLRWSGRHIQQEYRLPRRMWVTRQTLRPRGCRTEVRSPSVKQNSRNRRSQATDDVWKIFPAGGLLRSRVCCAYAPEWSVGNASGTGRLCHRNPDGRPILPPLQEPPRASAIGRGRWRERRRRRGTLHV